MDSPVLLMVPLPNKEGDRINNHLCLMNVTTKKGLAFNLKEELLEELQVDEDCDDDEEEENYSPCIVGSSHGWLAILDNKGDPLLLDPFSKTRIRLPPKHTLPDIDHIEETNDGRGGFKIIHKNRTTRPSYHSTTTSYEDILIRKVILSSNPSCNNKYIVVILYQEIVKNKIAFCRNGDDVWSDLHDCKGRDEYSDVVFSDTNNNMLFALDYSALSVEVWNMDGPIPTKKLMINPKTYPKKLIDTNRASRNLYTCRPYLALSSSGEEVYCVVRYMAEYVCPFDGRVIKYDSGEPGVVYRYRTIQFHVYKLDLDQKVWAEVESLNNVALVLGSNHSKAMSSDKCPGLKGNSIYFTDDRWDRIDISNSYGGHDLGIFNLRDGTIQPLVVESENNYKIHPPPFWLIN